MLLVLESDTSIIVAVATLDMVILLCIPCDQQQLASWRVFNTVTVLDNLVLINQDHGNDHGDVAGRGLQGSRPKHPSATERRVSL
jgi:hypothetical protein